MYSELWRKCYPSVCSVNILGSNGAKVRAFSGFKIKGHIVTDDIIYDLKDGKEIEIIFYKEDGVQVSSSIKMEIKDFLSHLPAKREFENLGFVLVPDRFPEFNNITPLKLCERCDHTIGKSIGIIGFQFEHNNLSLKTGVISSFIDASNGHSYIQYDGTIKPGNTGAPLLKLETGSVIGIVSNKMLGVLKSFKEMIAIIDSNLEVLNQMTGKQKMADVDIAQVLVANQHQIKHISKEFFKNATVRVGYALDIGHLTDYLSSKHESESDLISSGDSK